MKTNIICAVLALTSIISNAQLHLGINTGIANSEGDLDDEFFTPLRPAIGITLNYEISNRILLRTGATWAKVAGADKYGRKGFQYRIRNLSFESTIKEASLLGEAKIFSDVIRNCSPYIMGGIAVFHYNPYTYTASREKVYLRPLSTEGQGLPQYSDRKSYSLIQFALPFGGGIKYQVNDYFQIGLELGIRKLFTDYLDDISTTYINATDLLEARGQMAVDLSYRGDEVPGETSEFPDIGYPASGTSRGSPVGKDWYYFTMLHFTFDLKGKSRDAKTSFMRKNKVFRCPKIKI